VRSVERITLDPEVMGCKLPGPPSRRQHPAFLRRLDLRAAVVL